MAAAEGCRLTQLRRSVGPWDQRRRLARLQRLLVGSGKNAAGRQTSLVIDPADGRIPALLPEATRRNQARAAARPQRRRASTPTIPKIEVSGSAASRARCRRCPGPTTTTSRSPEPGSRRHRHRDDSRGAHHPDSTAARTAQRPQWRGDSVGRWEGDTLVVETINFTEKTNFRGSSENLRLVERYHAHGGERADRTRTMVSRSDDLGKAVHRSRCR